MVHAQFQGAFELVLAGPGRFKNLARLEVFPRAEAFNLRPDIDIRRRHGPAEFGELVKHDEHGANRKLHVGGMRPRQGPGLSGDINGDHNIHALAHMIEGNRIGDAAIHIDMCLQCVAPQ